ncbi:hypothetical protein MBANPS3_010342 [Mucor bainieri]
MSIEKLPLELLDYVFCFVRSIKDLAQCRLVCTRLDHPAERAMFTRPIVLRSASKAKALHTHLTRKNEMGKLITSLDLKTVSKKQAHVYHNLLPLAFTPAMHTFRGDIRDPVLYRILISIVKASNTSFSNLRSIPIADSTCDHKDYYKAIYFFRKTLQSLYISCHNPRRTPWHAFSRLGELNHLTTLTIDGEISSVKTLDRMLSKCTQLKTLNITLLGMMPVVLEKNDLLDWVEETHVEQVPSVTKLSIKKAPRQPDVVEYLLHKYPNVKEATILLSRPEYYESRAYLMHEAIIMQEEELHCPKAIKRIIVAMQNLPYYRISYMGHIFESVLDAIDLHCLEDYSQDLLGRVLGFVHSLKDLAQCRLVCTGLDHPAERAMFARPIVLKSASKAKALHTHLKRNKELGKLITFLELKRFSQKQAHIYLNLLPLVFTPAMETFRGDIRQPIFFRRLISIAKASGTSFSNLKAIPTADPRSDPKDFYRAVYFFRETLQSLYISCYDPQRIPWHAFDQLGELNHLTTLTIDGEISSVKTLDRMLSKCTQLKTLHLALLSVKPLVMQEENLLNWAKAHVEQVPSVTTLSIAKARQPDIAEYLLYKYPNVKDATVRLDEPDYYEGQMYIRNGMPMMQEEDDSCNTEKIERIMVAMQNVPCYRIVYKPHILDSVLEAIDLYLDDYSLGSEVTYGEDSVPGWLDTQVYNGENTGSFKIARIK